MREVSRVVVPPLLQRPGHPGHGDSSTCAISSPPDATTSRSRSGSASRNGPGASGSGRSVRPSSSAARPGCRHPRIDAAGSPRRRGRRVRRAAVTRAISAARPLHLGDEHEPEAAEDAVDAVVRQESAGGVLDARSGRRRGRAPAARRRRASTISGATSVEISSPPGGAAAAAAKPVVAGSGRELEHRLPGPRVEQLDHPLGRASPSSARRDRAAAPSPAGDAAPVPRPASAACVGHAATPLNGGMIVLAVRRQRLLLTVGHQVDGELVDPDRLELPQLRRRLLDGAEHARSGRRSRP